MTGQTRQPASEKSPEERRELLGQAVAGTLAQQGTWRVKSQSDYDAVVIKGKKTNHVLHLILSVVTMGLWLPVWLILVILNQEEKRRLAVDAYGNISTEVEGVVLRPEPSTDGRWVVAPTTRLGLWAVRLAGAWVGLTIVAAPLYLWVPGGELVNAFLVYGLALAAGLASGVLALIAIRRDKERALSVYAAVIPLLFFLALVVAELVTGGEH
ncbi:MAG: hypothetical protein QNJ77_06985 [Acidimicrobiia bacterium]|nr:hypothetical protein [Acidimicrobiia bacterium]